MTKAHTLVLPLALVEVFFSGLPRPTVGCGGGRVPHVGCSIDACLLLNYAFRFLPATRVSAFVNLTPVVAVAAAYAVLDERFTGGQVAAAVAVILGA